MRLKFFGKFLKIRFFIIFRLDILNVFNVFKYLRFKKYVFSLFFFGSLIFFSEG